MMNDDPFKNEKEFTALGCFLLGLGIIFFILTLSGCQSNMPPIDVSFWAGDSAKSGITRSQESKTIECSSPEFDTYTCLSYADIQKIYGTLLECKQWPTLATSKQLKRFVSKNSEVINHVLRDSQESVESVQR